MAQPAASFTAFRHMIIAIMRQPRRSIAMPLPSELSRAHDRQSSWSATSAALTAAWCWKGSAPDAAMKSCSRRLVAVGAGVSCLGLLSTFGSSS